MAQFQIRATLNLDKKLIFEKGVPQNSGENLTSELIVGIPFEFQDFRFFLEFSCPQGKKFISAELTSQNSDQQFLYFSYQIEGVLLQNEGLVYIQLVARNKADTTVVFRSQKSAQSAFFVAASIEACDMPLKFKDFFTEVMEKVDQSQLLILQKVDEANTLVCRAEQKISDIDTACDAAYAAACEIRQRADNGDFDSVVSVGSVTAHTLANGSSPSVEISTVDNNTLNFSFAIPQGDKGERGDKGEKGDKADGVEVVDNLNSTDTTVALSANQGRVLKEYTDMVSYLEIEGFATEDFARGERCKGKRVDHEYLQILPQPDILPDPTESYGCAFSPDGTMLAITTLSHPYLSVYDTTTVPYTKLAAPNILPSKYCMCCRFSPDGTRLVVGTAASPYVFVYDTTTKPFTKIANPSSLPPNIVYSCNFNKSGTRFALAHAYSPYFSVYTADTLVKLANPSFWSGSVGIDCAFSNDEKTLVVVDGGTKNQAFFFDTTAVPYTLLPITGAYKPTTACFECCVFSPDETMLFVGGSKEPYFTAFDLTVSPCREVQILDVPPTGQIFACCLSPDGKKLVLGLGRSPTKPANEYRVLIYDTTTMPYTLIASPPNVLPGNARDCCFSADGGKLAFAHLQPPSMHVYNMELQTFEKGSKSFDRNYDFFGFALTDVKAGEKKPFALTLINK